MTSRYFIAIEFLLLCIVLPTVVIVYRLAEFLFPILWISTAYCIFVYMFFYHKKGNPIWRWDAVNWKNLRPLLIRWAICSVLMLAFIYVYDPDKVFNMIRRNPDFVPWLLILYPILSALPQEIKNGLSRARFCLPTRMCCLSIRSRRLSVWWVV